MRHWLLFATFACALALAPVPCGAAEAPPADIEKDLATAKAEIAALKQQLAEAKARCDNLRDLLAAREKDLAKNAAELETVVKDLAFANDLIQRWEERGVPEPPPRKPARGIVRGKVKSVDKAAGRVVLDIGQRQKVEKGWSFIVFRGDEYVGKVVVDEVRAEEATAHCVQKEMKAAPEAGDDVTTRLSIDL